MNELKFENLDWDERLLIRYYATLPDNPPAEEPHLLDGQIIRYLSGATDESERSAIFRHIEKCRDCADRVRRTTRALRWFSELETAETPAKAVEPHLSWWEQALAALTAHSAAAQPGVALAASAAASQDKDKQEWQSEDGSLRIVVRHKLDQREVSVAVKESPQASVWFVPIRGTEGRPDDRNQYPDGVFVPVWRKGDEEWGRGAVRLDEEFGKGDLVLEGAVKVEPSEVPVYYTSLILKSIKHTLEGSEAWAEWHEGLPEDVKEGLAKASTNNAE